MSSISTKLSIISDNWLMQNAAEVINGDIGDDTSATWLSIGSSGEILHHSVHRAAIQFECLVSLIEQIVFCDELHVMGNWTHTWAGLLPEFKLLSDSGIIREFSLTDADQQTFVDPYIRHLSSNPIIRIAHAKGLETLQADIPNFEGQVVNGIMPYLGYSSKTDSVYTPHPVRSRFIQRALSKVSYESSAYAMMKLNNKIDSSRAKYARFVGLDGESSSLICKFPSIAIHCLMESPKGTSPIETALQMRGSSEFQALRKTLHEFQNAVTSKDMPGKHDIDSIDTAILEVERRLKIRSLTDADGFSELNTFKGLPLKVPDLLRKPVIPPKHTTALFKLAITGKVKLKQLLKSSLGITDPAVVESLYELEKYDKQFENRLYSKGS